MWAAAFRPSVWAITQASTPAHLAGHPVPGSANTISIASGSLIITGTTTFNPAQVPTQGTSVTAPMTLSFGTSEAFIYTTGTGTINAQINQTTGAGGPGKFGGGTLVLAGSNTIIGDINANSGTLRFVNPVSSSGTPINSVTNGQTINANGAVIRS